MFYRFFMGRRKIIETDYQIKNRNRLAITFRVLRSCFGLTLKQTADMTGLSFSAIAKFEKGDLRMSEETLTLLFSIFEGKGVKLGHHENEVTFVLSPEFMATLYEQRHLIWPVNTLV